jgi:uncharacterized protein YaaR (DUF327 family)
MMTPAKIDQRLRSLRDSLTSGGSLPSWVDCFKDCLTDFGPLLRKFVSKLEDVNSTVEIKDSFAGNTRKRRKCFEIGA